MPICEPCAGRGWIEPDPAFDGDQPPRRECEECDGTGNVEFNLEEDDHAANT